MMVLSAREPATGATAFDGSRAEEARSLCRPEHCRKLDAVTAAAEGQIASVRMTTRKPPNGLEGAPYLVANGISVDRLNAPKRVFAGNAREAAAGFPANVNVAAALSLAGIGPDRTTIEIWADPTVDRNCHTIEVEADSARFSLTIENVPSENPKTGKMPSRSWRRCEMHAVVGT
jgi:aspartate dehydrogenase